MHAHTNIQIARTEQAGDRQPLLRAELKVVKACVHYFLSNFYFSSKR